MDTIIDMMYVVDQSRVLTNILAQKNAGCLNLQLAILFFVKSIISDMHHRITYMSINFQQNRVSRSVKSVRTNTFAKKIASCINLQLSIVFFKKSIT